MNATDFVFKECDLTHNDLWFDIVGDTKKELTDKYMEQCMVCVSEAVFSMSDGEYGIKRIFPFNFDVISPDDSELYRLLKSVATAKFKELNIEE